MAGMQRFVTYLYYYKEEEKLHNTGFAKIEIRGNQCMVEIHLKGIGYTGVVRPVYLFAREEELVWAVEVGKLSPGGECRILLPIQQIGGSPYGISNMKGIYIPIDDSTMYASRWDDGEICRRKLHVWKAEEVQEIKVAVAEEKETEELQKTKTAPEEKKEAEEPKKTKAAVEEKREAAESQKIEAAEAVQREEKEPQKTEVAEEVKQNPSLHATEVAAYQRQQDEPPLPDPLPECFLKLQKKAQTIEILETGERQISGVHIELRDLRELPKSYWSLGNNSFLMHGFFVYSYLLLGKKIEAEQETLFLGVPGIYDNKERLVASLFGFDEFLPKPQGEKERQGYWCHKL